jgi:hydrogenase maturation protein HypF
MVCDEERWRIALRGRVQGVGFRPFVSQAASRGRINGEVRNDGAGVVIEAQGAVADLRAFLRAVVAGPPAARIESVATEVLPARETDGFLISESGAGVSGHTDPPADRAPCSLCLGELTDESDDRYRHPFLTCTACGPRFTLIESLPFDRDRTTMRDFAPCPRCDAEYRDPADRRFHAQLIACPDCGPRLAWTPTSGPIVHDRDALAAAGDALRGGRLIALKGVGGFHLACDATDTAAVARLRALKARGDKPFALMAASVDVVRRYADCDAIEESLLLGPERPVVLLRRSPRAALLADGVAPGIDTLGFMLPYTPLHHLLIDDRPLVMTSANRSGEPLVVDNGEASVKLPALCDGILAHDRRIAVRCDDSVVRCVNGGPYFVRRSRGYVPDPIHLPAAGEAVLAVGGELKAAPALAVGDRVYPGPHVGDLRNWESIRALDDAATHLCRLLQQTPAVVACDAHPDYASSRWAEGFARKQGARVVRVYHHEAHVAAWRADVGGVDRPALVACFDGTGYGRDGTVWGGEFFLTEGGRITRLGHLKPVPLPGGDRAIEHPARMALAHLWAAGLEWSEDLSAVAGLSPARRQVLRRQLDRGVNCPLTSSVGRLFDAVAALAGVRNTITYEGQAAVELEALADPSAEGRYEFAFLDGPGVQVDAAPLIGGVFADLRRGVPIATVAGKFHASLADAVVQFASRARDRHGVSLVGLTGGAFQNRLLLLRTLADLRAAGFDARPHRQVPCNDGGLAVGQAVLARRE